VLEVAPEERLDAVWPASEGGDGTAELVLTITLDGDATRGDTA
jgi:hypothetical protein